MDSNKILNILLIEDSESDALLLRQNIALTGKSVSFRTAGTLAEAFGLLQADSPDVVLLDLSLPDSSGLDTVKKIRQEFPNLPFVVLTGMEDDSVGVRAVRMGAGDYLIKGQADGRAVLRAIRHSIERKAIEKALHFSQQELRSINLTLELRVKERTSQLENLVSVLHKEIAVRKEVEKQLMEYQKKLRQLSSEIMFIEERERRQVAMQLHDSIGQLLSFSKKELGVLVLNAPESIKPSLIEVWGMIKEAVEQARTLTFDLSPSSLYTLGLSAALEELGEDFAKRGNFAFKFTSNGAEVKMSEQIKVLLYRSVRELLTNIIKHSGAKNVAINLKCSYNCVQIDVRDDGFGFNIKEFNAQSKAGFGLFSIRERLEAFGGSFVIKSAKAEGTEVVLKVPLRTKKQKKKE
jgi:signal transduction histidine kinase